MSIIKKILKLIAVLFLVAIVFAAYFIRIVSTRAIPDYNATIQLENLKEEVTVYRDEFAVPNIIVIKRNPMLITNTEMITSREI